MTAKAWMTKKPSKAVQAEIKTAVDRVVSKINHYVEMTKEWKIYLRKIIRKLRDTYTKWHFFAKELHINTNPMYSHIY